MDIAKDWQCNKSLTECLEHMFTTHTASDVTFLLGEDREVVHAHKFILISRSPVFYAMFEGPMSEKGEVALPDIQKHVFVDFLRYLYTDHVSLNDQNAMYVMYAAKKYCVDRLTEECSTYIKTNLNVDNACKFLEHAHLCSEEKLSYDCLNLIIENPWGSLQSKSFTDLCKSCVCRIIDSDDLAVTENLVYETVMRWSEAECGRQNLEVTDANRREVLGEVLYSIRFPLMDKEYFGKEVIKDNVLCLEDIGLVLKQHYDHTITSPNKFNSKARRLTCSIERFDRLACSQGSWVHGGSPDAISFQLSKDVHFHGVGMYGCYTGSGTYSVTLQLYDQMDIILASTEKEIATDQTKDIYDVMLDSPLKLKSSVVYTAVVTMKGNGAKRGLNGKKTVEVNQITVEFIESTKCQNGTCINHGQIPCLLLSA